MSNSILSDYLFPRVTIKNNFIMIPIKIAIENSDQLTNNLELANNEDLSLQTQQATSDKKPSTRLKCSLSQIPTSNNKYSQNLVGNYLQTISQIPLLSNEEEIEISRQIANLSRLEQSCQQLAEKLGRQPSYLEWAQEVNMMLPEFHRCLQVSRRAKDRMIQANLRLVVFIAKKYLKRGLSLEDLIQEGSLGLIRAAEKFEPKKGCKFSTYAYWWIRQAIMRAVAEQSRTIRLPVHVHDRLLRIKKMFALLSQKLQRQPNEVEIAESLNISIEQLRSALKVARMPLSLQTPIGREDSRMLEDCIKSDVLTPNDWIVKELMCEEVRSILSFLDSQERDVLSLRFGLDDGVIKTPAEAAQRLNLTRKEVKQIRERAMEKLRHFYSISRSQEYLF